MENTLNIKKRIKKGFTLVELLVVIAILAILASVSVVGYLGFTDKAKQSKADSELAQAETVLMTLEVESEEYDATVSSTQYKGTISISNANNIYTVTLTPVTSGNKVTSTVLDDILKSVFTDLSSLEGEFSSDETNAWLTYTIDGKTATSGTIKISFDDVPTA